MHILQGAWSAIYSLEIAMILINDTQSAMNVHLDKRCATQPPKPSQGPHSNNSSRHHRELLPRPSQEVSPLLKPAAAVPKLLRKTNKSHRFKQLIDFLDLIVKYKKDINQRVTSTAQQQSHHEVFYKAYLQQQIIFAVILLDEVYVNRCNSISNTGYGGRLKKNCQCKTYKEI